MWLRTDKFSFETPACWTKFMGKKKHRPKGKVVPVRSFHMQILQVGAM